MNLNLYDEIYEALKEYLKQNSVYKPYVYQIPPQKKKFPLVIVSEITNQNAEETIDGMETFDEIGYEIEIYCSPADIKETKESADEIASKVDYFMKRNKFSRITALRAPNIDSRIYRMVLRYSAQIFNNRGKII